MIFDLAVVLALIVCALSGYMAGFLNQLFRVVRLIGVLLLMTFAGKPVERCLLDSWSMPVAAAHVLGILAGALIVYVILSIVLWQIERRLGRDESGSMRPWNRKAGMWLGLAKGIVIILFLLAVVDALSDSLQRTIPSFYNTYRKSFCSVVASWYNPFRKLCVVDDISAIQYALEHPEILKRVRNDKRFVALMEYPTVKEMMTDERFRAALENKDYYEVLRDPRLAKLLKDKEFLKLLRGALDALREAKERDQRERAAQARLPQYGVVDFTHCGPAEPGSA